MDVTSYFDISEGEEQVELLLLGVAKPIKEL